MAGDRCRPWCYPWMSSCPPFFDEAAYENFVDPAPMHWKTPAHWPPQTARSLTIAQWGSNNSSTDGRR